MMLRLCLLWFVRLIRIQGECLDPLMKLVSDNPRHTCTEISATDNITEYSCTSLIRDFPRARIKYCPVGICLHNKTWTVPSISCALSECYPNGYSNEYEGQRTCTSTGRACQSWTAQEPHQHSFQESEYFPDRSVQLAASFCRDPNGTRGAPWCYTTDVEKQWEFCGVRECSELAVKERQCENVGPNQDKDNSVNSEEADYTNRADPSEVQEPSEVSSPLICANSVKFNISKEVRFQGNTIRGTRVRSAIECVALCSQMTSCKSLTYRKEDGDCLLYGIKGLSEVKTNGYLAGVKSCND